MSKRCGINLSLVVLLCVYFVATSFRPGINPGLLLYLSQVFYYSYHYHSRFGINPCVTEQGLRKEIYFIIVKMKQVLV